MPTIVITLNFNEILKFQINILSQQVQENQLIVVYGPSNWIHAFNDSRGSSLSNIKKIFYKRYFIFTIL